MGKLAKLGEDGSMAALSDKYMFALLLHSIALGLILVVATFYEVKYLSEYPIKSRLELDSDDEDGAESGKNSPEKVSPKDKKRFYRIALGSVRECGAIFAQEEVVDATLLDMLDFLGGGLFKLVR